MNHHILNLFDYVIQKTPEIELFSSSSQEYLVIFESDSFKQIDYTQSQGIALRIIHKGNIGFSFSNDFQDQNIAQRALDSSQFGQKAAFSFPLPQKFPSLNIYDPKVDQIPLDSMISLGQNAIDQIKSSHPNVKINLWISKQNSTITLKNSKNLSENYRKSLFSFHINTILAQDDEILDISNSKTSLNPFSQVHQIIQTTSQYILNSSQKIHIKTGNYPVLFTPKAFETLISILTESLNGSHLQKGVSCLSHQIEKKVLSDNITLIDDGLIQNGIATAPFDDEGTPTQKTVLFENGILKQFIFDLQSSGQLNQQSTGNASRTYSSIPTPRFRNISVQKGNEDYHSLISASKEAILVDQFIGAGQSNVLAGEFSMNLALAFKIENGQITGRLKNLMMSGNVLNALNKVLAIGNQLYQKESGFYPYILLDEVSISSKI